jgi:hypothetical protein
VLGRISKGAECGQRRGSGYLSCFCDGELLVVCSRVSESFLSRFLVVDGMGVVGGKKKKMLRWRRGWLEDDR